MRSTIISVVLTVLILAGGFGISNMLTSQKEPAPRIQVSKRIPQVRFLEVDNGNMPTRVYITGPIEAKERIELFSEVTGTYLPTAKPFKEGNYFKGGEAMIKMDNEEFLLSIKAAKSALMNQITLILPDLKTDYPESFPQWQSYLDRLSLEEALPSLPEPKDDRERYFISARNLYNQYYSIQSQEIRAQKYVIKAPFSGKVSSSQINAGTLVRSGQKLGEFVNPYSYEMEAAVSLGDLTYVRPGSTVQLISNDIEGTWTGRVARISDVVDPNTQTAKLFINVSGKNLREGMYLEGYVKGRTLSEVVEVDRGVMLNDSTVLTIADVYQGSIDEGGDSTATAEGPQVTRGKLVFTLVTPVQFTKKSVFLKGLKDGTYLVNEPLANAYDGMEVALYRGTAQ